MKLWDKIFGIKESGDFTRTFKNLKAVGKRDNNAEQTYKILQKLDFETPNREIEELVNSVNQIHYPTNTNGYFEFFFPIISHILYYKPHTISKIINQIVGPNFANGISDSKTMIETIQSAMNIYSKDNKYYVTKEGKEWTENELDKYEKEITQEINKCQQELDKP